MDASQLNGLTNFIWSIADDVLRNLYVRGKYRDVILPMTVLRRLDAVLEPTKKAVLEMKTALDREGVAHQDDALRAAAGQAFYNTSPFLLRDLKSRGTQQKLKDDFEAYLDGFSPNVQEILINFEFRNQIPRLSKADALGQINDKFLDKDFNLRPYPVGNLPGLDNHSMGTMFEELVRRGKVQLIDATQWYHPLRKNMGKKNCELLPEDIQRICDALLEFKETAQSKIFLNAAFGYWKVKVERPLRLHSQFSRKAIESLRFASGDEDIRTVLYDKLGDALFENWASVKPALEQLLSDQSDQSDKSAQSEQADQGANI